MASLYSLLRPFLFMIDAETAHRLTLFGLRAGALFLRAGEDPERLRIKALGRTFSNPVGIAAGFDKNGEVVQPLFRLGFGFVEAGTVTPKPQPGNPRPRVFRLKADRAVINRFGFNSEGHIAVRARLEKTRAQGLPGPLGINIGANKTTEDIAGDYVQGVQRFGAIADYFVVNISSPNTPGLRAMQGREALNQLLNRMLEARSKLERKVPLLVKVAPDLSAEARQDIAALAIAHGVDGLIVSNTTISRPESLRSPEKSEGGGLSGRPLFELSTEVLADMYRLTHGRLTLIGVGGIASGADAYAKIRAGASLVQIYTGLIYEGPGLVKRIKRDLAALLEKDGFSSVAEAVGADHRERDRA